MYAIFILINGVVIIIKKTLRKIMKHRAPGQVVSKSLSLAGFLN